MGDKLCIDQTDIQTDLRCLPIFLAGCNGLLIVSGLTYTSRLWCCVELFVYVTMVSDDPSRKRPVMLQLGDTEDEKVQVMLGWREFNASTSECYLAADKERIILVLRQHP